MALRILLVGGGSGGHLAPLAAVAQQLRQLEPDCSVHAVCTDNGTDLRFLQAEGITATELAAPKRGLLLGAMSYRSSKRAAMQLLDQWQPDVVFSKGGRISVPLCLAAHAKKIPVVIHESDAVMGRANSMVSRFAKAMCFGFAEAAGSGKRLAVSTDDDANGKRLKANRYMTGNPIRASVTQGNKTEGLRITELSGKKPILLVTGGSQGAAAINQAIIANIDTLLQTCDIIHITGEGKEGAKPHPGYWSCPFAFDQMPHLLACADLSVCRAGAGTISEMAACRIPSLLVPIRGLAHDHQYRNALAACASGGCLLIDQKTMNSTLTSIVADCVSHQGRMKQMAAKIHLLYHPDAARRIAKIVVESVES